MYPAAGNKKEDFLKEEGGKIWSFQVNDDVIEDDHRCSVSCSFLPHQVRGGSHHPGPNPGLWSFHIPLEIQWLEALD